LLSLIQSVCESLRLTRRELGGLVLVFLASLPMVTPRLYSSDEVQYFSYLRSLWFDHDVSFENEYRYFVEHGIAQSPGFQETFLERYTEAGRRINFGTIGSAILWAPFYAVADAAVRLTGSAPADGFSGPYVAAVAYGSATYAFLAILLSIAAARRVLAGSGAVLAGMAVWLGSPLLFYMYVAPPFAHACSAFAVALFVTIWLQVRSRWTVPGAVALGLSGALMAMVREQDVFFALGPAVDFLLSARARPARATITAAIAATVAFAAGLLPQLTAYLALNGRPGPSQLVTRKMLWHAPHALEVLASPEHGFLFWTPLAVLALAGLAALALAGEGEARRIGTIALLMVALQVYVNGSVDSWSAAGAFGHRRFVAVTILLVLGIAALWRAAARSPLKPALAVLLALAVWWNLGLTALFGTRMMDRQRLELGRNARDVFVTLPLEAPRLAYRYLFDRDSFYSSSRGNGGELR
jgi:hypothetical protein